MNRLIITKKDNFVWLNVTEEMKYGHKKREEIWLSFELFAINSDDDSESLLESHEDIDEALRVGYKIGIEVGQLPSEYKKTKINEIT